MLRSEVALDDGSTDARSDSSTDPLLDGTMAQLMDWRRRQAARRSARAGLRHELERLPAGVRPEFEARRDAKPLTESRDLRDLACRAYLDQRHTGLIVPRPVGRPKGGAESAQDQRTRELGEALTQEVSEKLALEKELAYFKDADRVLAQFGGAQIVRMAADVAYSTHAPPAGSIAHEVLGAHLRNMTVKGRTGRRISSERIGDLGFLASQERSGKRCMDTLFGGGDPTYSNGYGYPSSRACIKRADSNSPDKDFTVKVSKKLIRAHQLKCARYYRRIFSPTSPCLMGLAFDGTDIDQVLGEDPEGNFTGDAVEGLEDGRFEHLQRTFKVLKKAVRSTTQSARVRRSLGSFIRDELPTAREIAETKRKAHGALVAMYTRQNTGSLVGQQKTQETGARERAEAAERGVTRAAEALLDLQSSSEPLTPFECHVHFEIIRDLFRVLRTAGAEYFPVVAQDPTAKVFTVIARFLVTKNFSNDKLKLLLEVITATVKEATNGETVVVLMAFDGKHSPLQQASLVGLAKSAKGFVGDFLDEVSTNGPAGNVATARKVVALAELALAMDPVSSHNAPVYLGFTVPNQRAFASKVMRKQRFPSGHELVGQPVSFNFADGVCRKGRITHVQFQSVARLTVGVQFEGLPTVYLSYDELTANTRADAGGDDGSQSSGDIGIQRYSVIDDDEYGDDDDDDDNDDDDDDDDGDGDGYGGDPWAMLDPDDSSAGCGGGGPGRSVSFVMEQALGGLAFKEFEYVLVQQRKRIFGDELPARSSVLLETARGFGEMDAGAGIFDGACPADGLSGSGLFGADDHGRDDVHVANDDNGSSTAGGDGDGWGDGNGSSTAGGDGDGPSGSGDDNGSSTAGGDGDGPSGPAIMAKLYGPNALGDPGDVSFNEALQEITSVFPTPLEGSMEPIVPLGSTHVGDESLLPTHLMRSALSGKRTSVAVSGKKLMQYATLGRVRRAAMLFLAHDQKRALRDMSDEAIANALRAIGPPGKRVTAKQRHQWGAYVEALLVVPLREVVEKRVLNQLLAERGLPGAETVVECHDALEAYVHARPRGLLIRVMESVLNANCPSCPQRAILEAVLAFVDYDPLARNVQAGDLADLPRGSSSWSASMTVSSMKLFATQQRFDERRKEVGTRFILNPNPDGILATPDQPHVLHNVMTCLAWTRPSTVKGAPVAPAELMDDGDSPMDGLLRDSLAGDDQDDDGQEEGTSLVGEQEWVQCDRCDKWRKIDAAWRKGDKWECKMNFNDPLRASCEAEEQLGEDAGGGDDVGGDGDSDHESAAGDSDAGVSGGDTGAVRRSQRLERARKRRRLEDGGDDSEDSDDSSADEEDGGSGAASDGDGASSAATEGPGLDETDVPSFLDDPHRGGEPGLFLSMAHIAEAADNLDDPILKSFAAAAYDKHSQAVTVYVTCNTALWQELWRLGYYRDSVVLKVLGRATQAWSRPGLTFEARTKALFCLQQLIKAAMGNDMFDVRVLSRKHYGGFPVQQLLDLCGMVDVRNQTVEMMPELFGVDGAFHNSETWLTTRKVESMFGSLASDSGGRKPRAADLFGRARHIEMAADIRGDDTRGFSVRVSKRKWKVDDNYTEKYNDGSNMAWDQDKQPGWYHQLRKRAKAATRNRSSPRSFNRAAGGT